MKPGAFFEGALYGTKLGPCCVAKSASGIDLSWGAVGVAEAVALGLERKAGTGVIGGVSVVSSSTCLAVVVRRLLL